MDKYKNIRTASIVYAYYLVDKTEEQMRRDIEFYQYHLPLHKVYIESHRGLVDINSDTLQKAKHVFESYGIETSGCITTTVLVNGERKPSIFDTFCFTDEAHIARLVEIVEHTARNFDEIILDDYFFTACRCEKCIKAKGKLSWKDYRLNRAAEVSKIIVDAGRKVNPKLNFIIKYPNWYESFQECGYNPREQKDIFDMIYTGTESRNSNYSGQHLQRYESYSLVRWMENAAPGRNGGGWIDLFGSNISEFLQQADLTYFAKAKELMLFNFELYLNDPAAGALGIELQRVDRIMGELGKPMGIPTYEPYDSDGEDQLINYIGQLGIPLEPVPYFDENADTIFLTENSAEDQEIVEKLKAFVENGGSAIVTSGFMKKTIGCGFEDMTSVRPTDRKISGNRYMLSNLNVSTHDTVVSDEPAMFTVMQHKNNATWYDVLLCVNDNTTAVVTEDYYGKGILNIINIPDNYGDLYRLPKEAVEQIGKDFCRNGKVYLGVNPGYNLFLYDNDIFGVYNYSKFRRPAEVILRGDDLIGFEDIETGIRYTKVKYEKLQPKVFGDCASCIPEPIERVFDLPVQGGSYRFFRLLKK